MDETTVDFKKGSVTLETIIAALIDAMEVVNKVAEKKVDNEITDRAKFLIEQFKQDFSEDIYEFFPRLVE